MADNVDPSLEKVLAPNPNAPDIVSDSSSSDDATSTKSSDLKAPDDAATLNSEPSLSSPTKESSESNSNKDDTSRSQSPLVGAVGGPGGVSGAIGDPVLAGALGGPGDTSGALGGPVLAGVVVGPGGVPGSVGGPVLAGVVGGPSGGPGAVSVPVVACPAVSGLVASGQSTPGVEHEAGENDPLLPRRRVVKEQALGEEEQVQANVAVGEQVVVIDTTRRSPTSRRFISSLSQRFEYSNEYIVYLLSKWQAFSLFWSDSRYLVYFQLGLIAVSIANVCIGSVHLHNCPLFYMLPILLIVVGLTGIMAMIARMILVLYKFYTTDEAYSKLLRKVVFVMNCIYLTSLTWEFTDYMLCNTPSTDVEDPHYCHPFFISYIKGYNCTAFTIVLISLVLHGPAYLFYSWNIGGPGLPDS